MFPLPIFAARPDLLFQEDGFLEKEPLSSRAPIQELSYHTALLKSTKMCLKNESCLYSIQLYWRYTDTAVQ